MVNAALDAALGEVRRQGGPEYLLREARGAGLEAAEFALRLRKRLTDVKRQSRRLIIDALSSGKIEIRYIDDGHEDERHSFVIHQDDVPDLKRALRILSGKPPVK